MVTKRGLLIGSATGGLTGVAHDVEAMANWLEGLGFQLDIRQHADATRDGILAALDRLTRDSRDGDVAVVYYSGHGGYSQIRSHKRMIGDRVAPRATQYLVPIDHDKRKAFRGIFRVELSRAMQRLAEKTSNITVVLDCCHSTDAVRDEDEAVLKGVIEPWGEGIESHLAWLQAQGIDLDGLPEIRNPSVVLLSACEVSRQAFEVVRKTDGVRCGLFTDCLLQVLRGLRGAPDPSQVTWDDLMRRVVDRCLRDRVYQRPQASGPSSRYIFTERRQRRTGTLTLQRAEGRWSLNGGAAAGVVQGDRYRIIDPLVGTAPNEGVEIEVSHVNGYTSTLAVGPEQAKQLDPGMLAIPRPGGPTHQRCRVDGTGALADELRERVLEIAGLGLAGREHTGPLAFAVDVDGHQATVHDGNGKRLRWPWRDVIALDPLPRAERVDAFIEDLRRLARGAELLRVARSLDAKAAPRRLAHTLAWGLVEQDGASRSLPPHGAELTAGDRVFVRIENTSPWPVRLSIFDVGVGRAVTLLNPNEPEGIDLGTREYELLGAPELRSLAGLEVRWPHDTPPDGPGEESLVVFVSTNTLPLTSWETSDWYEHAVSRDVGPEPASDSAPSFLIRQISFRLHPPRHGGRP